MLPMQKNLVLHLLCLIYRVCFSILLYIIILYYIWLYYMFIYFGFYFHALTVVGKLYASVWQCDVLSSIIPILIIPICNYNISMPNFSNVWPTFLCLNILYSIKLFNCYSYIAKLYIICMHHVYKMHIYNLLCTMIYDFNLFTRWSHVCGLATLM